MVLRRSIPPRALRISKHEVNDAERSDHRRRGLHRAEPRGSLISYVTDRPGHDHRYAIDASKLSTELGHRSRVGFEAGLRQTVRWYLDREDWWRDITGGAYQAWIDKNYGLRIAV